MILWSRFASCNPTEALCPSFTARNVANCLWAFAKLGYRPLQQSRGPTRGSAAEPGGRDASAAAAGGAGAAAAEQAGGGGVLGALCRRAEATLPDFTPQHVGNALWALGTLGKRGRRAVGCPAGPHVCRQ